MKKHISYPTRTAHRTTFATALAFLMLVILGATHLPAPVGITDAGPRATSYAALAFDGVDGVVTVDSAGAWLPQDDDSRTLELWFKTDGSVNASQTLLHYGNGGATGRNYVLRILSGGTLQLGLFNASIQGTTSVDDGAWHHAAVTYDNTNDSHTLYLDGQSEGTLLEAIDTPNSDLAIGASVDLGNHFAGRIDEVRVWGVARSQTEIQDAMLMRLDGTETDLVAAWSFDEATGSAAADVVGSRVAALGGGTAWSQPGVLFSVTATDGFYEDRVDLAWPAATDPASLVRVERDGDLLAVLARTVTTYTDATGDPGTVYEYCILITDGAGHEAPAMCDDGSRVVFKPTGVAATDGTLEDQVLLSWNDKSGVEAAYNLYRDRAALRFVRADGTDRVTVPTGAWLPVADDNRTLEAWFKTTGAVTANQTLVHYGNGAGTGENYVLRIDGNGHLQLDYRNATIDGVTSVDDGAWHHVAATYDNATDTHTLYLDGAFEATGTVALNTVLTDTDFSIGSNIGLNAFYDGYLDDVRVWNVVRTEAEVQATMDLELTGTETGLAAYFPMNEGAGTGVTDLVGGVVGVLTGATWDADALLTTLGGNTIIYNDTSAVAGTTYLYCVEAEDPDGFVSLKGCDTGLRGFVMPPAQVDASDGQYPNFARITWVDQSPSEDKYTLYRDEIFLDEVITGDGLSGDLFTYDDATAVLGVTYTYCVTATTGGQESAAVCDAGMRGGLASPEGVAATFNTFDDKVEVTWDDVATTEDGFEVWRKEAGAIDSTLIATTGPGSTLYIDRDAAPGQDYDYCVRAFSDADATATSYSEAVCAAGRRSYVVAPDDVAATDGDFEDRVRVSWSNPSTTAMLYKVYRVVGSDTTLIDTVPIGLDVFDDLGIASGVDYDYCVSNLSVVEASAALQEAVTRALLRRPGLLAARGDAWVRAVAAGQATPQAAARMTAVGDVMLQYSVAAGTEKESAKVCDVGRRTMNAPTDVTAGFEDFEDHVQVSWVDNSSIEDGFHVYRLAPGQDGALSFDGVDDFVEAPNDVSNDFDGSDSFTLEVWFRYEGEESGGTNNAHLVTKQASSGTEAVPFALINNRNEGKPGQLKFFRDDGSNRVTVATAHEDFNDGVWHHAAAVHDGVAQTMRLYIDGTLEGEATSVSLGSTANGRKLRIGRRGGTTEHWFEGELDEVRIWNVVRTQEEIVATRHQSLDGSETGLVAYWPFNEGEGTTAVDLVAGLDGDLMGGAEWTTTAGETAYGDRIGELSANRASLGDYTGLPGTTYTYTVTAFDALGESDADADTGRRILLTPGTVLATDGTSETEVTVTWVDNARAESAYHVFRDGVLIGTTAANRTTFVDNATTGLVVGMEAIYGVAAADSIDVDGDGTVDVIGFSETATDAGHAALQPPANLSASTSYDDEVVLIWTDVSTLNDGYTVYQDGSVIDNTLGGTATSYTDTGVSGEHTYCVEATTTGGGVSAQACQVGGVLPAAIPPVVETLTGDQLSAEAGVDGDEFGRGVAIDGDVAVVGAWRDKTLGNAIQFDGTTESRVDNFSAEGSFQQDESIKLDALTLEMWVRSSATNNGALFDMVKWNDGEGFGTTLSLRNYNDLSMCFSTGSTTTCEDTNLDVADGAWHHVAVTWDRDNNGRVKFFIDGVESYSDPSDKTTTITFFIDALSDCSRGADGNPDKNCGREGRLLVFGQRHEEFNSTSDNYRTQNPFDGEMDEVRLWKTVRTAQEIQDFMFQPLPEDQWTSDDLVAYWPLDEKENLVKGNDDVIDEGPNGLHGDTDEIEIVASDVETGSAYVFTQGDTGWEEGQQLFGDLRRTNAGFGKAVDVVGNYLIVGAQEDDEQAVDAGAAYVFKRVGDTWALQQKLIPGSTAGGLVGSAVALTADETYALVGAQGDGTGRVYVFKRTGAVWTLDQTLTPGDADVDQLFGRSLAVDGTTALVGAGGDGGRAILYTFSGTTWSEAMTLKANDNTDGDNFGGAVDIDGDRAIVGAFLEDEKATNAGAAYFFYRDPETGNWGQNCTTSGNTVCEENEKLLAGDGASQDRFGRSVTLEGDYAVVGAIEEDDAGADAGAAYVFRWNGDSWVEVQKILPGTDDISGTVDEGGFGFAATLQDGNLLVGAPGAFMDRGAAYPFLLPLGPSEVQVSDGTFDNRVQLTWENTARFHDGFHIYRRIEDGSLRLAGTTGTDASSFDDFDAPPGGSFEYCVTAFNNALLDGATADGTTVQVGETALVCDTGWRPADGFIGGRIAALGGGGTQDVAVCLAPSPNRSLLFDGVGGYVVTSDSLDLQRSFTIEFWAQRSNADVSSFLLSQGEETDNEGLALGFGSGNKFRFQFQGNDLVTNAAYPDADWHHWAVTYEPNGTERKIYRDGVLVEEDAGEATYAGTGLVHLGRKAWGVDPLEGRLDEVRIWDHVRDSTRIADGMNAPLTGSEEGLLAYWSLDEGTGLVAADVTPGARHGTLVGGVHWTESDAFALCATTDLDGNYTFSGLRYGESTTFSVTPSLGLRSFDPRSKNITLSPQSPIQNEVDFTDQSAFSLAGLIQFEGTVCPVPDVEIHVDDVLKGTTAVDGTYSISVDPSNLTADDQDPRRIEPVLDDGAGDAHTFSPELLDLVVTNDVFDINFVSKKTRILRGFFGGSCNTDIGTATLKIFTEDGCFERIVELNGNYAENLPPQKYLVQVLGVETDNDRLRADIIGFFDDLGAVEVDLTAADDTLDFIYRAPLAMTVQNLPATPGSCTALDYGDDRQIPAVPIFTQGTPVNLTIEVNEDYGNGSLCPVDAGTVTVFDGLADAANEPLVLEIADGAVAYTTTPGDPDFATGRLIDGVDRSYQKALTLVAEVAGKDPVTQTEWGLITGRDPREATFISATTDDIPLLVLHDPPGSNSYAYIEEGTTNCSSISKVRMNGGSASIGFDIAIGGKSQTGGPGFLVENGAGLMIQGKIGAGRDDTRLQNDENGNIEICMTSTERFSTPGDMTWVGEDLYVGVALNLVFAIDDVLGISEEACMVEQSEELGMTLDEAEPFETTFVYGQSHITHSLLPAIENLIEIAGDAELNGEIDGKPESVTLQEAYDNWERILDDNEDRKASALENPSYNRSFSAGADYEFNEVVDTTTTLHAQTTRIFFNLEGGFGDIFTAFGYDQIPDFFSFEQYNEWVTDTLATETASQTIGYVLSDGDTGDFFSVDVGIDPVYKTHVFGVRSGASSNPWEGGTQKRDNPQIEINPPLILDADPEGASFEVTLINASESQERRQYVLAVPGETNPKSLGLTVTGDLLGGQRLETFTLEAGEARTINLDVFPSPSAFAYEDVGLMLYPATEYEIWQSDPRQNFPLSDTAFFSVYFSAPCSEISILRPKENWILNAATIGDSLEVILEGFEMVVSESDTVETLGMEYRIQGTSDWLTAAKIDRDDLGLNAPSWSAKWQPQQEGLFDVRAFTTCPLGGTVYSEVRTGTVDTQAPQVFGTPEPANQVLSLGLDIAITFDEPLDCGSVITSGTGTNAELVYLDGPDAGTSITGVAAVCNGTTLVLSPPGTFDWSAAEGRLVEARLRTDALDGDGNPLVPSDLAGNPLAEAVSWPFTVRRNAISWRPANLDVALAQGSATVLTATLMNGRTQPIDFTLPPTFNLVRDSVATDTTAIAPSVTGGTLVAGGIKTVQFTLPDTLGMGFYAGTLMASATDADGTFLGEAPLYVTADVGCAAPGWVINPADFAFSMTLTAEVRIHGVVSTDTSDVVAAFVGGELRGVAPVEEVAPSVAPGQYRVNMLLYSNRRTSDIVTFEVWDADTCTRYTETNRIVVFADETTQGTFDLPVSIEAPPPAGAQDVALSEGWTWFSFNTVPDDAAINAVLAELVAAPGDLVKSQTTFSQFSLNLEWVGTLDSLKVGAAYLISLKQAGGFQVTGTAIDPVTHPIPLLAGWNWIGYLPEAPSSVDAALASLSDNGTVATGDVIKSQYGFAEYVDGLGWLGSLVQMEPGLGYLIQVANAGTLTYPPNSAPAAGTASRADRVTTHEAPAEKGATPGKGNALDEARAGERADAAAERSRKQIGDPDADARAEREADIGPGWMAHPNRYTASMVLVAEIERDGVALESPATRLAVFRGEEVRGMAYPRYVPALKRHLVFLMVYGEAGQDETLTLRLYDGDRDQVYTTPDTLRFRAGAKQGSVLHPVRIDLSAPADAEEALPVVFALEANYPNPFNPVTTIRYALPQAERAVLEVYDLMGRRVARLVDQEQTAGRYEVRFDARHLASGVYFYRLHAGAFSQVRRMVLLK